MPFLLLCIHLPSLFLWACLCFTCVSFQPFPPGSPNTNLFALFGMTASKQKQGHREDLHWIRLSSGVKEIRQRSHIHILIQHICLANVTCNVMPWHMWWHHKKIHQSTRTELHVQCGEGISREKKRYRFIWAGINITYYNRGHVEENSPAFSNLTHSLLPKMKEILHGANLSSFADTVSFSSSSDFKQARLLSGQTVKAFPSWPNLPPICLSRYDSSDQRLMASGILVISLFSFPPNTHPIVNPAGPDPRDCEPNKT